MDRKYDVITFISKYLNLRRPIVVIFGDIIKVVNKGVEKDSKRIKKTQKKSKELEIM